MIHLSLHLLLTSVLMKRCDIGKTASLSTPTFLKSKHRYTGLKHVFARELSDIGPMTRFNVTCMGTLCGMRYIRI